MDDATRCAVTLVLLTVAVILLRRLIRPDDGDDDECGPNAPGA